MWIQLSCHTQAEYEEDISEYVESCGAVSVTLSDAGDQPVLEPLPNETPLWSDIVMTVLFQQQDELAATRCAAELESRKAQWQISKISTETLEDKVWEREWMKDFHPMQFGDHLWIYPSWSDLPDDDRVVVKLDPGLAFGSGTHPTTALCMEWLDKNKPLDLDIIDYGCGSGILAVAAAKLSARSVIATDIDPQALLATEDNRLKNDIADGMIVIQSPDVALEQADVVLANILCEPLIDLADHLISICKPNGRLILSGILAEQSNLIEQRYQPFAELKGHSEKDGWVRLDYLVR